MRRVNRSDAYGAAHRRERGVVAIIVALTLAVLVAFAGLAIDLGKLYVAKTELSNAADACALAAARDLTKAVSLAAPEAAGMTVGSINRVVLQSENVSLSTNGNVTFSKQFAGPYLTKDQFTAADVPSIGYVRCTVSRTGIANWFMQVLDATLGTSAVAATAVASTTQSQTTCALPVAICKPAAGSSYNVGDWVSSKVGSDNQLTGNFMWVAYPGQNVPDMKTLLTGSGQCTLPTLGTQVGHTGNIQSMDDAWNTRFGIYHGSYNPPPDPTGISDFTGFAYSPVTQLNGSYPTRNVFPDFRDNQRPNHTPYQGHDKTTNLLEVQGTTQSSTYYSSGADRRLALVPVTDCAALQAGSQKSAIDSWACVLMLHPMEKGGSKSGLDGTIYLEYRGDATDPSTPCATQGIPGSTSAGIGPMVPVLVQ
ncbi:pilus assembly protein TadG-related protein [Paraburkholderia diazotrophica]|uniref:Putative Flp pilus-assembly TadE/G-like n=1 Tax=Paraburkholderia diazotrophica TaxID=667676 RepID=A0A1H7EE08_9BURK|nr:pilus assembly protein TadG-related protein [Paraburkholderia diazotrophica]SEK09850.1 Putative Flp pilus-assembly TadE/G-like [Paraburkholderia diazotrophica]